MAKYFCRVEYLESTGTQWTDTGVTVDTSTDEVEVYFQLISTTKYQWLMGEHDNGARFGIGVGDGTNLRNIAYGVTTYKVNDTQVYNSIHKFVANSNGVYLDGVQVHGFESFSSTSTIYLFNLNVSGGAGLASGKIWAYRHKRNGVLIRDLIPVLDNSLRPAMFDRVTETLFYNQGSGEFNVGRQIHPVEYLQSTGTQYINTGVYPTQLTEVEYRCAVTGSVSNNDSHLFGSRLSASSEAFDLAYMNTQPNGLEKFRFIHGTTTTQETTTSVTASQLANPHTYYMSGTSFKVDGSEKMSFTTTSFTGTYSLWLFGVNSAGSLHNQVRAQRVYKCKIWDNNTLVRDFQPAIDENGTPFMFDQVECKVYTNAGTGQFKVGKYLEQFGANKKLLRKKYDMMLSSCFKKKPYYCEVEYLASDGNQYIDTEFKMVSGQVMTFNGNIMWTASQGNANFFYGYRSVNTAEYRGDMRAFFIYGASPEGRLAIRFGVNTDNSTLVISKNTKYNIAFDGEYLKIDGTNYSQATAWYNPADFKNMWLFNCNTTGYYSADVNHFIGRIYNWQIWSGGVLVRDLIPVLDWNYTPCMYDKVSGQLFYNQGTGTFSYGREIHYVDYLESTGTQYIDTGVYLTNNHSVEIDYQLTIASQSRKGLYGGLVANGARHGALTSPSNQYLEAGYGSTNVYYQLGLPDTNRHVLKQAKNELYFDGNLVYTFATATFTQNFTAPLGNFNYTNYAPLSAKYYSSKWMDGDTLVRDFYPAIDENGVGYWFDKITHTCFLNSGSGAFKYPATQVEYLQSSGTQYINTGIFGKSGLAVKTKVNYTYLSGTGSHAIGGEYASTDSCYFGMVRASGNFTYLYRGTVVETNTKIITDTDYTLEIALNNGSQVYTLNGNVISSLSVSGDFNSNKNLYLYAINSVNGADVYGSLKMCYLQIHDGGVLVRDFIPAFKDGSAGMWDKANNVMYINAGTGTFNVGKVKESRWF